MRFSKIETSYPIDFKREIKENRQILHEKDDYPLMGKRLADNVCGFALFDVACAWDGKLLIRIITFAVTRMPFPSLRPSR